MSWNSARATLRVVPMALLAAALIATFPSTATSAPPDCTGDLTPSNPFNPVVELRLPNALENICIEVLQDQAPATALNFLAYLFRGDYDGTFFHRAVNSFIIQGGGYYFDAGTYREVASDSPVVNEPCTLDELVPMGGGVERCSVRGNERGTLAMAKVGDPNCASLPNDCVPRPGPTELPAPEFVNSATNEWFINLADNRENLDNQNGGFTVFARVLGDGMMVADQIGALAQYPATDIPFAMAADPADLLTALTSLPLLSIPAESPSGYGCFEVSDLAAYKEDFNDPGFILDPNYSFPRLMFLSGNCGTSIPTPGDFVANPSMDPMCTTPDQYGEGVVDFFPDGTFLADPQTSFSFTCPEIQDSLANLANRQDDLGTRIADEVVEVSEAIVVPEPGAAQMALASLLTLLALASRARSRVR